MALGYFPKLYPDELLCSAVARYRVHTMASAIRQVNRELYNNHDRYTSVALPHNLNLLHEQIGQFVGMSASELARRATLFPYYAAFQSENARKRMLDSMLQTNHQYKTTLGWNPYIKRIKVCPDCFVEDIERFGEAYWHRTHQLDCVHFCDVHIRPLVEAMTRYGGCTPLGPLLASTSTRTYLPYLSESSKQRLIEVARLAREYLDESTRADNTPLPHIRLNGFRELYSIVGGRLNVKKIRKDFISYFGEQCIDILELQIDTENQDADWLDKIFGTRQKLLPSKRIAFEIFSKNYVLPRAKHMRSKGYIHDVLTRRAWRCQNPAAEHFGKRVITNVYPSNCFQKNDSLIFKCSCGYVFRVRSSRWDHHSEPLIEKVCEYGPAFLEQVRKLYGEGIGVCAIGRKLNAHKDTISRLLRSDYKIFNGETHPGVYEAIAVSKRIRKAKKLALRAVHPDYGARDKELTQEILETASFILAQIPPVQITIRRLLEVSKIEIDALVANPYFPRTLSAILTAADSYQAFSKRQRQQVQEKNSS